MPWTPAQTFTVLDLTMKELIGLLAGLAETPGLEAEARNLSRQAERTADDVEALIRRADALRSSASSAAAG